MCTKVIRRYDCQIDNNARVRKKFGCCLSSSFVINKSLARAECKIYKKRVRAPRSLSCQQFGNGILGCVPFCWASGISGPLFFGAIFEKYHQHLWAVLRLFSLARVHSLKISNFPARACVSASERVCVGTSLQLKPNRRTGAAQPIIIIIQCTQTN